MLDLRVHPRALSDKDLETLRFFGVTEVVVVADGTVHPASARALIERFHGLVEVELARFERAGLRARAALGVHPGSLPRRGLHEVLDELPALARKGRVVAMGLLGLRTGSDAEADALVEQLALARRLSLPVFVTTPADNREGVTRKLLALLKESRLPPQQVLVDGAVGRTARAIRELGHWVGLTVHPEHLTAERAVSVVRALGPERVVLTSGVGDGAYDLLSLPRAVHLLQKAGLTRAVVQRVTVRNARAVIGP